jgi:DNA topoisomerase-2
VPNLGKIIDGEGIVKKFKLSTSLSCLNFVLFNYKGQITRYKNEIEILEEFFGLREQMYTRRKEYMLSKLRKEFEILENKVRFIQCVISEEIKVSRVKRQILL